MVPNAKAAPVATESAAAAHKQPATVLDAALKHFRSATRNPEIYLQPQPKKATKHSELVKQLYDHAQLTTTNRSAQVPDQLVVEHMDEEQIWQQLELQNESLWSQCLKDSGRLLAGKDTAFRLPYRMIGEEEEEEDGQVEDIDAEEEEEVDEDESELGTEDDDEDDEDDNENGEVEAEDDEDGVGKPRLGRKSVRKSIVDDQFFKLGEMEEFLEAEDRKEMQKSTPKSRRNAADDDDDDGIDYFKESAGESEDGESDAEPEAYNYADFFSGEAPTGAKGKVRKGGRRKAADDDDEDQDDDEEVDERAEFLRQLDKKNRSKAAAKREDLGLEDSDIDEQEGDEDEEEDDEDDDEDDEDAAKSGKVKFDMSKNKYRSDSDRSDAEDDDAAAESASASADDPASRSSHEHRQERLRLRIADMEAAAMGEKSWQLRGEINSDNRPQNSLLEEVLEFDSTVRPAPVITEETTLRLEDIIRQRIKDRAWNDVERKHKPANTPQEFRKQLVLDQEKSKQSLAQIYEKEYMREVDKLKPAAGSEEAAAEESKEFIEIRTLMKDVFAKLDALGNFFYTPKVAQADVRIITNIAAINMEEVAPLAVSDAALLAPEEVRPRDKGDVLGKSERTQTDKNRERRQKKQKQREAGRRTAEREAERAEKGLGTKAGSKEEKKKLLTKVSKARNVLQMKESTDGKSIKSSKQFFSQLQDEVSVAGGPGVKSGKGKGKRKAVDASQANAKKFKL